MARRSVGHPVGSNWISIVLRVATKSTLTAVLSLKGDEDMPLPSAEALLCIAERFQTMLVGVLGFAGVILTLLHTAREAKRQGNAASTTSKRASALLSTQN
jgi:hypothetical protein